MTDPLRHALKMAFSPLDSNGTQANQSESRPNCYDARLIQLECRHS
ncbi:hypothetical protein CCACVL1_25055 [Corchorus capsularis]|uniref:Uncharacterized protein n=1 Tax=Corchorus capsularis TaxID=210143 RepID=A0A1R3GM15_COCAP|nr:hypothetical protein CCACVL1_25055 [Corchorus capsularis]